MTGQRTTHFEFEHDESHQEHHEHHEHREQGAPVVEDDAAAPAERSVAEVRDAADAARTGSVGDAGSAGDGAGPGDGAGGGEAPDLGIHGTTHEGATPSR